MDHNLKRSIQSMLLSIVFLLLLGFGYIDSHAQEVAQGKATFYVY